MTDSAPLIQYASEPLEQPAERLLRHIVAWTAIVEGGTSVLATALRVALANKWLATPNTMAWGFDAQWEIALTAAEALTMCALLVGGVMLLTRTCVAIPILRLSVACSIVLMFV